MANTKPWQSFDYYSTYYSAYLNDIQLCHARAVKVRSWFESCGITFRDTSANEDLKPGLYVLCGSAGAGKSTLMRDNFDRVARSNFGAGFLALKGGEPEYYKMSVLQILTALNKVFKSSDKPDVITIDSLAALLDYEASVSAKALNTRRSDQNSATVVGGKNSDAVYEDVLDAVMTQPDDYLQPSKAAKKSGVPAFFMQILRYIDTQASEAGMYIIAIVNPALAESDEFRSAIGGVVTCMIELGKAESTIQRCRIRINQSNTDEYASLDGRRVVVNRMAANGGARVDNPDTIMKGTGADDYQSPIIGDY